MLLRSTLCGRARVGASRGSSGRFVHAVTSSPDAPLKVKSMPARHARHRPPTTHAPAPESLRRASLMEQLQNSPPITDAREDTARHEARSNTTATASPSATSSSFLTPSHYETKLAAHHARTSALCAVTAEARDDTASVEATAVATSSSVSDLSHRQTVLREAFDHAYKHHNVALRKDRRVYAQEVAAFRQAHGGRSPRAHEVSPYTHATLAPVSALRGLRHADASRSSLHELVKEAVVLQEAVTKNNLVKSRDKTLVRCLRCFHVYAARPRTLWGDDVEQSWLEVEQEKDKAARANALAKNPRRRKRLYSVGRQEAQRRSDPTQCPQCGSRRAQWMMEYVHHRTHIHGAQHEPRSPSSD